MVVATAIMRSEIKYSERPIISAVCTTDFTTRFDETITSPVPSSKRGIKVHSPCVSFFASSISFSFVIFCAFRSWDT